jgi:hypothetical protein
MHSLKSGPRPITFFLKAMLTTTRLLIMPLSSVRAQERYYCVRILFSLPLCLIASQKCQYNNLNSKYIYN